MDGVTDILGAVVSDVWTTLAHNWPYLLASVVVASAIQVYVGTDRLAGWLRRRTAVAVVGAVLVAAFTPFCSCGTTAVVLGAMASAVPWAPVVAFMVSSPLTSPGEYVMSVGLFGPGFATTYFVAAIVIGLAAGVGTYLVERTGWLVGQARMAPADAARSGCGDTAGTACGSACGLDGATTDADAAARGADAGAVARDADAAPLAPAGRTALAVLDTAPCCATAPAPTTAPTTAPKAAPSTALSTALSAPIPAPRPSRLPLLRTALIDNGKRLAIYFLGFAALGYLLIELIPTHVLTTYLGGDSPLAVPLAALLGVPVYLNADGSLPMVASLMDGGMGAGPALAFLITGAGTSIGAVSGMLVIARWRVVALVVGFLLVGATVVGWVAPLWL